MDDDAELLKKLAENLDHYFHLLFMEYKQTIFAVARSMLDNPQDAEEVTADTFVQAHKALKGMLQKRREIKLRPWLFKIVKNLCRNCKRRRGRLKRPPPGFSLDQPDIKENVEAIYQCSSAEDEAVQHENNNELYSLLRLLPEHDRRIVMLYYIGGLSDLETAKMLERKWGIIQRPEAIRKARQRAFKNLQEMVANKKSGAQIVDAPYNESFLNSKKENIWNKEMTI